MTHNTIAQNAILRSLTQGEIAHIEANPASKEYLALSAASAGSVDTGSMVEFWGTRDGDAWRVHVRIWPQD